MRAAETRLHERQQRSELALAAANMEVLGRAAMLTQHAAEGHTPVPHAPRLACSG